ncbi:MAG: Lipid-A-disaccharide synthase [uncultured bacterium]|nr:MAG: Lipid-A-disaccharide synthase [uncultured bacterium]HBH18778.1 lipid-A-disaccharide synthase [Cyanobacteria bacterium UBA9579]
MKKIFIVTGEHSGDLHASYVVKELRELIPDIQIEAVGGVNLEAEGIKLFSDHSKMSAVGLDAIKSLWSHIKLGKKILDYLKNEYKPDLVLLIDYGGFNLRLAKVLKKNGINVFYYISPQVWASRKGRLNVIKKYISKMMVIMPFEENVHKNAGVNVEYVGHPLMSQLNKDFNKQDFIEANNLDPYKKIIGIFPGSRKMEINYLLPIFLKAAAKIKSFSQKVQFCVGQAPSISDELINKHIKKFNKDNAIDIKIIKNQNHPLLASSDVAMLASGTITFEAAIYKTPMVVSYKGPLIAYLAYLLIRYLKFVALPNVIAGKKVVEEFLQYKAKPDDIAFEVMSLLHNQSKREKMIQELELIQLQFGDKIASKEVARIISEHLNKEVEQLV